MSECSRVDNKIFTAWQSIYTVVKPTHSEYLRPWKMCTLALQIVPASTRARKYVMVQQWKSPSESKT